MIYFNGGSEALCEKEKMLKNLMRLEREVCCEKELIKALARAGGCLPPDYQHGDRGDKEEFLGKASGRQALQSPATMGGGHNQIMSTVKSMMADPFSSFSASSILGGDQHKWKSDTGIERLGGKHSVECELSGFGRVGLVAAR
jgi:hypothetical protein